MAETFNQPTDLQRVIEHSNNSWDDAARLRAAMNTLEDQDVAYENNPAIGALNLVGQVKAVLDELDALQTRVNAINSSGQAGVTSFEYEVEFASDGVRTAPQIGLYNRRQELLGKLNRLLKVHVHWQAKTVKNDTNRSYARYQYRT